MTHISIHAPAKGATSHFRIPYRISKFQSTLPLRERRNRYNSIYIGLHFNPRSRKGSDNAGVHLPAIWARISIHAPAKGATRKRAESIRLSNISIHAPAKGATNVCYAYSGLKVISIHAPTKGATLLYVIKLQYNKFQSTLPQRERQFVPDVKIATTQISIHAPTTGATQKRCGANRKGIISIHAPTKGATMCWRRHPQMQIHFNPRSRKGSDKYGFINHIGICHFNPRSRKGSDKDGHYAASEKTMISIHAPAKGATLKVTAYLRNTAFQSTLPQRERPQRLSSVPQEDNFNPRSRKGSDAQANPKLVQTVLFQSTLPQRERQPQTAAG